MCKYVAHRCYNFSFVGTCGGSKVVHFLVCEFNQKRYEKIIVYTMIAGMLSLPAKTNGTTTLARKARLKTVQMRVLAALSDHGVLDLYTNTIVTKRRTPCATNSNIPRVSCPVLLNQKDTAMTVMMRPRMQRLATDL